MKISDEHKMQVLDNLRRPPRFLLYWGIPIIALVTANVLVFNTQVEISIVILAIAWIGIACLMNAVGCGRVHCWFTGPWCILLSITLAASAYFQFQPFGASFSIMANVGSGIAILLWLVPEIFLGKYFSRT